MCPIYGALKIFESPRPYAHGYLSRTFNGLLFRSIMRMCVQNLKFVALPVPEIVLGVKFDTPLLPFLQNSLWASVGMDHENVPAKFEVCIKTQTHS